ncbi:hypothetical protein [Streptomyces brasiliensis]|uniref:Uncharacterized protein n=1 Tax=Streptomyces brasiliensis TaxID=1954 RepID=A0A917P5W4_9ACTN|nr:hypothetical protein [Streptomyces brasiliensis]GGJ63185.1 hypothetical protein GCM10010121_087370 [Streptomyces brasiliensis]
MAPRKPPSSADQQLIEQAARHGFTATAKQLARWRRAGLLPGNIPGGGLGRGRGSTSTPPPESFDLVLALARLAGRGKRPTDLALLLFAEGLPVPEATVRAAFRAAVDAVAIPGEDSAQGGGLDLDERLDQLSNHAADRGQTTSLVPARARRIDERIADVLGGLPAELLELDQSAEPSPLTPQDATLTAMTATLGGSVPLQDIGALLRAMSPGMPANPFASLVETTREDVPETAARVLADDGSLTFIPDGDARDLLRALVDTVPLEDLAAGWRTAQQVREWALDLCQRVEGELDTGQIGEAVTEWLHGRQLRSGISVIETLRDRRWSPSKGALSALMLLFQCQMFTLLDSLVPGCQWHVLQIPGVVPPPIYDLILGKVVGPEAGAAS